MVSLSNRTSMALFSDPLDHYSHRVRIVMCEKGVTGEIIDMDSNNLTSEILEVSPYSKLPVLVDRDVCLYDSVILMEYLDERFPHPPLLPVYPVSRAQIRLFIQRIENDWCEIFDNLIDGVLSEAKAKKARQELKSQIIAMSPILKEKPYFMSDEFSLVDCCIAPILWRLPLIGIELQKDAKTKPIYEYMQRVFTKSCFIDSLSELERDIRST
ncbi:MAG: stringent starvation protein A [Gammaproteobacteria bacterium]|nr:stringent starvation protein A [Gammaproteobacteria bacterium]HJL96330.1 glutathione S-transferase N-terminal domain-containing protein [SAR86 cluster bacterium]